TMKLYQEILTTTLEKLLDHYGKDHFSEVTRSFICPKCTTEYLCFSASDLILYKKPESSGWRVYGVLEEDEQLEDICDCQ
ncbi:MAG: hypothetical protein N3B18_04395, partial [Desulfobacterota bacterium]|nr:hypothetical protein [Thermodesulfobacteriota bacterium]